MAFIRANVHRKVKWAGVSAKIGLELLTMLYIGYHRSEPYIGI